MENDPEFQLVWQSSDRNTNATSSCRNQTGRHKQLFDLFLKFSIIGIAYRLCDSAGNWQTPIVSNCISSEYVDLMQQVALIVKII